MRVKPGVSYADTLKELSGECGVIAGVRAPVGCRVEMSCWSSGRMHPWRRCAPRSKSRVEDPKGQRRCYEEQ